MWPWFRPIAAKRIVGCDIKASLNGEPRTENPVPSGSTEKRKTQCVLRVAYCVLSHSLSPCLPITCHLVTPSPCHRFTPSRSTEKVEIHPSAAVRGVQDLAAIPAPGWVTVAALRVPRGLVGT